MADGPIDYSGAFNNVPDPTQAFTQGIQSGLLSQQGLLQQQMQRAQFARMQQMQQTAMQVAQSPTPTRIAQLAMAFPEISEQTKRAFDMYQPAQQQAHLKALTPVYAAAQGGRPDIAAQLLDQQAQAFENSGQAQDAQEARTMAQLLRTSPQHGTLMLGTNLAGILGPEKFGQTFKDLGSESREQGLFPSKLQETQAGADLKTAEAAAAPTKIAADIANVQSQVAQRAGQLALDRDKLQSETALKLQELHLQYGTPPDDTRKLINESATAGAAGEMSAARLTDLAQRLETAQRTTGLQGNTKELIKRAWGAGDGETALKQEYGRIVNNQALGQIKDALGGRVTDVDMKVALSTVPDANAAPEVITSYLRGAAKLQQLSATLDNAKAEWLAQAGRAGHLGPLKQDITVMGTQVPAGTTFADWSRQFVQKKAEQLSAQSALAKTASRSYMRWADPGTSGGATPGALGSGTFGIPGQ